MKCRITGTHGLARLFFFVRLPHPCPIARAGPHQFCRLSFTHTVMARPRGFSLFRIWIPAKIFFVFSCRQEAAAAVFFYCHSFMILSSLYPQVITCPSTGYPQASTGIHCALPHFFVFRVAQSSPLIIIVFSYLKRKRVWEKGNCLDFL